VTLLDLQPCYDLVSSGNTFRQKKHDLASM
jgi:hypothetical protein